MKSLFVAAVALVALAGVVGCNKGPGGEEETEGLPECSSVGKSITYENYGKAFFDKYCNSCHSATSADRHGAPAKITFDSQSEIEANAEEAWSELEEGAMPPKAAKEHPGREEVAKLGEWLGCGAP